jgi:predicted HTH transcriptional regulator
MIMKRSNRTTQEFLNSLNVLKEKIEAFSSEVAREQQRLQLIEHAALARGTQDIAQDVLKDVQAHPGAARKEISKRLKVLPDTVTRIVGELKDQEKLVRVGSRRTTRWFTPESLEALTKPQG